MSPERVEALRRERALTSAKFAAKARDNKAEQLTKTAASWAPFVSKDGRTKGFAIPAGSVPGRFYLVTLDDCDCADARRQTSACKHRRALRIVLEQRGLLGAYIPTPAPLPIDDKFWARFKD